MEKEKKEKSKSPFIIEGQQISRITYDGNSYVYAEGEFLKEVQLDFLRRKEMNLEEALEYLRKDSNNRITLSTWNDIYIKSRVKEGKEEFGQYKVIGGCEPFLEETLSEHTLEIFGKDAEWEVYPNMKTTEGQIVKAQELNSDIIEYLKDKNIVLTNIESFGNTYRLTFLADSLEDRRDYYNGYVIIYGKFSEETITTSAYVKHYDYGGCEEELGYEVWSYQIESLHKVYNNLNRLDTELRKVFAERF